jgi:hypothetical protein
MRYRILIVTLLAAFVSAVFTSTGSAQLTSAASARSSHPPDQDEVGFAQRTSDLLLATLFAALTQEFDETTPDNVEEGKQSIGLVFSDSHSNFRLVGINRPLRNNDRPQDTFEREALGLALDGGQPHTAVQRVDGTWFYRRSIPLSVFRAECQLCHTNFAGLGASDWVGALMLKVPIR